MGHADFAGHVQQESRGQGAPVESALEQPEHALLLRELDRGAPGEQEEADRGGRPGEIKDEANARPGQQPGAGQNQRKADKAQLYDSEEPQRNPKLQIVPASILPDKKAVLCHQLVTSRLITKEL